MEMSVGEAADRLYQVRQARYAKQREVDLLQEEETKIKDFIINTLPKDDMTGVQGRVARVSITTNMVPQVDDWESFYKYIRRNKAWELLHRRPSVAAIKERWAAGKKVPGVVPFTVVDVSLNKI